MALIITFLLGMGNFAWHSAVLDSRHPMVTAMERGPMRAGRAISYALEFAVLVGVLFATKQGHYQWIWAYLGYSVINCGAAWLIVSRRI